MTGELMVHSRRAGQKVYDLRERVLGQGMLVAPALDHHRFEGSARAFAEARLRIAEQRQRRSGGI